MYTLLLSLCFSPLAVGAVYLPYATLVAKDVASVTHGDRSLLVPSSSHSRVSCQLDHFMDPSLCRSNQTSKNLGNGMINPSALSARRMSVPIAVPLACVLSVLLVLLVLKLSYLKQRRLETIHELPNTVRERQKGEEESMRRASSLVGNSQHSGDFLSMRSRFSHQASKRSSSNFSDNETSRCNSHWSDSAPGFLVGMLGSPDWETNMQRELAKHQWRLRRESRNLSIRSEDRRTWRTQRNYAHSRSSTVRSRQDDFAWNPSTHQGLGRHSSLRIPHVSSFGELYQDTFRNKSKRPKSFNAVIDRMSASRSASIQSYPPATSGLERSNSRENTASDGCNYSAPPMILSQRPSTIREVDTPPSTVLLSQETFRFQVVDFGDGPPFAGTGTARHAPTLSARQTESPCSCLGSMDIQKPSPSAGLNESKESSIGGSWRDLPHFPTTPGTPISTTHTLPQISSDVQVNSALVEPHYFNEWSGRGIKIQYPERLNAGLDYGLLAQNKSTRKTVCGFSPLALDLGCPPLSELLVSELLGLSSLSANDSANKTAVSKSPSGVSTGHAARSSMFYYQGTSDNYLSPFSASVLNRQHSRVRDHVPFPLVAPPVAHLKSPSSPGRSVRFALAESTGFLHAASLVNLSAPVHPSPLRRAVSMGSRPSSGIIVMPGDVQKNLFASSTCDASLRNGVNDSSEGAIGNQNEKAHVLKAKASDMSLFLDLGNSSAAYEDEQSDIYSFEAVDIGSVSFHQSEYKCKC